MKAVWEDILNYWFGDYKESASYLSEKMPFWFVRDNEVDDHIRTKFLHLIETYDKGLFPLDVWKSHPKGFLALIILFDQFPRNIFREDPQAYAYDLLGLALAREFISSGKVGQLRTFEKLFVYLPFEHSESLVVQSESVSFFSNLQSESNAETKPFLEMALDYAQKHHFVIEKFGRYPHRNEVLGRESTPEERTFLAVGNIKF